MRVLFTTSASSGHFHPLVPLAQALTDAGHEVAFAGPGSFAPTVEALGYQHFAAGYDPADGVDTELGGLWAELETLRPGPEAGEFAGAEVMEFYWAKLSSGYMVRRMVPDLIPVLHLWQPDLVVRELYEVGGAVAAEAVGLPHAAVQVGHLIDGSWLRRDASRELDPIRQSVGLPADPELAMLYRHLLLSFVPPSYQDPNNAIPTQRHLRTIVFDRSGAETAPSWLHTDLPRPVIYATFGTVTHFNAFPDLFRATIAGLRNVAGTLIVTVGRDRDPAALGPQPDHVRVERYVPQSLLFPHCDLVVHHGGHNTTLAAVAAGLPQVVIPLGADQPANARRCEELGLGVALWPAERTSAAIEASARHVLAEPRFRHNAARLRQEMAALPGPAHAVELLEQLVASHRPAVAVS
ncbi:MAG: glycosyltransferase [Chloroflexota bacterium]|nr:glycosyltransferase [Chloroflexota bacterium]